MRRLRSRGTAAPTSGLGLATLGAVALLCSACGNQARAPAGAFNLAMMANMKIPVTVITLKSQPVTLTRELPGRTAAYLVADVRPQVSGLIKKRLFVEGSMVQAGQPLYQLDDAIYQAQYANAAASVQKSEAGEYAADLAAKRASELLKIDAESQQDFENANATNLEAKADLAAARASLASAAVNLAYARITSPISGRIGASMVTQGALVTANQSNALATVQTLNPVYVDVNQSSADWLALKQEIDAGRIRSGGAGTPATIELENGTIYPHQGRLQFADVTVDPNTGNFLLRILVPNPDGVLLPGMYVRAVIDEGVLPNGVLVPQEGIQHDPRGDATALVADPDNKARLRKVDIARAVGNQWLIERGLSAGDRLIVSGLQKVRPGMTVQPAEAPPVEGADGGYAAAASAGTPGGGQTGAGLADAGQH